MQSRWVKKKVLGPFGWLSIIFIVIFLLVVTAVATVNYVYQTSLQAKGGGVEKVFVVKKGENVKEIAQRLEEEGLIKNALVFRIYLFTTNTDNEVEAGSFKVSSNQTAQEIAEELQHGQLDKWVTLVEGLRVEEIAEKLLVEFDIDKNKFIDLAKEGYMFPDTYLIPTNADEKRIVTIMRANFDKKVDLTIKNQAKKNKLTLSKLIILASIVERESKDTDERPVIAGILLKRLDEGIPLAVDATIQYALGYQSDEKTWWKKNLTIQDLDIEGPFNTRKVAGIPPSPIANPGITAIKSVASPEQSPYYYYIHDKDGEIHFAETIAEHNANISKYLR